MVVAAQSWFSFDRDKVTATVKILAGAGHLWGWAISVSEKKKKQRKRKEGRNKLLPRKKYVLNSMKTWHWCLLPKIGKLIYQKQVNYQKTGKLWGYIRPKTGKHDLNQTNVRPKTGKPDSGWSKTRKLPKTEICRTY